MTSFRDRVRGVVASTALGDAMGAPIEKLTYEGIKSQYGRVESIMTRWHKMDLPADVRLGRVRGDGIVTDDTLMTVALINVYMTEGRHLDAYDMGNEFVKEIAFRKTFVPELNQETYIIDRLFYPEKYIFMRHVLANCDPREGGIGNMVNCGAAMYIAPIGIVNAGHPKAAYDEAILFAMGHQVSYGLEAAGVLAACVAKAFEPGVTVDDIVETAVSLAKDGTKAAIEELTDKARALRTERDNMDKVIAEFQAIMLKYSPMGDDVSRHIDKVGVPSNHYTPSRLWSIEELPMALAFIVLNDGDYYRSMLDGVNSGRDTDSIGVMAGVILGAMYGHEVIKASDIEQLNKVNRLDLFAIADRFSDMAANIIKDDLRAHEARRSILE
ncbi:ADP-ribosylglycohydrolase family protein [Paenibacillus sp. 1011MAR3C5]|uniref:ADP-ribosylglycohydrolase family protein n=1 Tax=Paenibacillus sp. 1011MAR3C5 TaxID=1675787 RepID=UPI000E6C3B88|nr:ADP-ribosylglycohydrolase family protein [Paenibacillus sp. 1011MAR3C5]RJE85150.1 ADP-ribosylglycohydrolase family protein [Paenibacillus sp. 1011MAR3C5]